MFETLLKTEADLKLNVKDKDLIVLQYTHIVLTI